MYVCIICVNVGRTHHIDYFSTYVFIRVLFCVDRRRAASDAPQSTRPMNNYGMQILVVHICMVQI